MSVIHDILSVALSAAPWLLFGFLAAGVLKVLVPPERLIQWLGGHGVLATARAAITGIPLPLCSCGAIPTALSLHREGAGRGPTTAFLISTPGVGVDSLVITYALLGPFMVLARALGALVTAIISGLLVSLTGRPETRNVAAVTASCGTCGDACADEGRASPAQTTAPVGIRLWHGIQYAFTTLLDDLSVWLLGGLLVAGVFMTFVPPQALADVGSGLAAMLLMAVIGIPMYICATAATPFAAAMLATGVSPGTVLVLLLAGPVTSLATLGALRRELGGPALLAYLSGILTTTVLLGLGVDAVVFGLGLDITAQAQVVQGWMPLWAEWSALGLLLVLAIRPARRLLARVAASRGVTAATRRLRT